MSLGDRPGDDATPPQWRAMAIGLLAGGFATGFLASRGGLARILVTAATMGAGVSTVRIALASRRPPIEPSAGVLAGDDPPSANLAATADGSVPTFTVIVAARNEVDVLPRLVADLGAQDHRTADGRPLFELIVIDDRSTDGTAQAALRAAAAAGLSEVARSVPRGGSNLPDGKGAALTAVQPDACRGDVIVVLDADAQVGPGYLSTLARYVRAGAGAITGRRRTARADSSWLAGAQADEQTADGEIQRGRWALGGLSEFRGNGIVVRRDLLARVGGWRAEALTEDIDLSSRIAAAEGVSVAWAIDADVWEEPVESWDALWQQRVRWAEGAFRRAFEHGPAVLASERLSMTARLDFAAYVAQLAAPLVLLGAIGGRLAGRRTGLLRLLVAAYAAMAGGLSFDSLRWETDADGRPLGTGARLARAARSVLFGVVWVAAVPAALWRLATREGSVEYVKMAHGASQAGSANDAAANGASGANGAAAAIFATVPTGEDSRA